MPLANNYFATRSKPYPVLESDLDTINNYLNTIADEVRSPSRGGTGLSSYTIGDIPWASATQTLSTLAMATDGHYLTSNGSVPQYRQIVQNEVSGLGTTETPTFDEVTVATQLNADIIAEKTVGAGITADGVVLKDGGGTFSQPIAMGSQKITGLAGPNISTDAANKAYVDSLIQGLDWNESVLDIIDFTASEPAGPTTGNRYINTGTGTSSITTQAVTANYIYEWNGTDWTETIPTEGYAVWVEDEDVLYTFNGSSWVKFGTTVTHQNLIGAGTNTHSQIDTVIASIGGNGAGDIITTDNTQTLTNKSLTSPTIGDHTNANHNHSNVAEGGIVIPYGFMQLISHEGIFVTTAGAIGVRLATNESAYYTAKVNFTGTYNFQISFTNIPIFSPNSMDMSMEVLTRTDVIALGHDPGGSWSITDVSTVGNLASTTYVKSDDIFGSVAIVAGDQILMKIKNVDADSITVVGIEFYI